MITVEEQIEGLTRDLGHAMDRLEIAYDMVSAAEDDINEIQRSLVALTDGLDDE